MVKKPKRKRRQRAPGVPQRIADALVQRLGREWKPGDRLPSVQDLSDQLGAGFISTHRAIRALVAAGLLTAKAAQGIYVADRAANRKAPPYVPPERTVMTRPLAYRRVDVMTARGADFLVQRMIDAFTAAARSENLDVRVEQVDAPKSVVDVSPREALAFAVFGSINQIRARSDQMLVAGSAGEPQVSAPCTRFDIVTADQERIGFVAGDFLRQSGFADVCFGGVRHGDVPAGYSAISAKRLTGLTAGLQHDVPPAWQLVEEAFDWPAGARLFRQYIALHPRPRAVYLASDDLAIGFMLAGEGHGLAPGRDYHLIGTDGQEVAQKIYAYSPLTTVAIPAEEIGAQAAALLIDRLFKPDQTPRRLALAGTIARGATVGPCTS